VRSGRSDNFQRLPPHRLITLPPRPGFDIHGYALAGYNNFEDDCQRANADRQRANAERQRAAAYDRQRADDDHQRADAEHQRAIAAEQQAMRVQQQRVAEHAESTRLHSVSQLQIAQLSAQVEALTMRMLQHPAPTTPATPTSEGSAEGTNQSATTASAPAPPPPPPPPSILPVNLTDAAAPVFEAEEAPAFAAFARSFEASGAGPAAHRSRPVKFDHQINGLPTATAAAWPTQHRQPPQCSGSYTEDTAAAWPTQDRQPQQLSGSYTDADYNPPRASGYSGYRGRAQALPDAHDAAVHAAADEERRFVDAKRAYRDADAAESSALGAELVRQCKRASAAALLACELRFACKAEERAQADEERRFADA